MRTRTIKLVPVTEPTKSIAASAYSNGIRTPNGNIKGTFGIDTILKFIPDIGYHVDSISINGFHHAEASESENYIFHHVRGDFSLGTYTETMTNEAIVLHPTTTQVVVVATVQ